MAGSPRLQSCRKATAGSIRSARWEGSWHASGAARISAADVVANVTGSYGETPTSCDPRVRFTARDIVSPAINPSTTGRMPSRKISRRISCAVAPSATRTPISFVRWLIECAMTAYSPIAASSRAIRAKTGARCRLLSQLSVLDVHAVAIKSGVGPQGREIVQDDIRSYFLYFRPEQLATCSAGAFALNGLLSLSKP